MLKTSLLGDQLREKVYVTLSFLFSFGVSKPRIVHTEVEVRDGVYARAEESFENKLTHILFFSPFITECINVKHFYSWTFLDDLYAKTNY